MVEIPHVFGLLFCLRRILRQGVGRRGEALAGGGGDLRAWVVDALARAWFGARPIQFPAVLCSMAHEGQWLCPALDFGAECPHALGGGGADATAVLPGRPIARDSVALRRLRRYGKLRIAVHSTLVDGLCTS